MKVKILKVYEKNGVLRVETETEYGRDNFGLSLDAKYKDPITQKPKYLFEVRDLLKNKYEAKKAKAKHIKDDFVGKEIDLSEL